MGPRGALRPATVLVPGHRLGARRGAAVIDEVHEAFAEWLALPDHGGHPFDTVDLALATVVANRRSGRSASPRLRRGRRRPSCR
jgi:hypothetical protein